ncbi:MAG TPA: RraA family protein [Candidatus Angelobacter sp.]|nr:RraA family protein [Candidatus Angelobacter sp.]
MTSNAPPPRGGVTPLQLQKLQGLSACVVASAIELCDVRLPNTGFSNASVRCLFEELPPVAGYAVTARIRTAAPPMEGGRYTYARTDWWDHVLSVPAPRIMVVQDMDSRPGLGAFIGEVYACILRSLGCVGLLTNGAARDLPQVREAGLQVFAGNVSVSHAYAHVFDFGGPVEVAGLRIRPGELLHGDLHGIQTVPVEIISQVLATADEVVERRHAVTSQCGGADFSMAKLRDAVIKIEQQWKSKAG